MIQKTVINFSSFLMNASFFTIIFGKMYVIHQKKTLHFCRLVEFDNKIECYASQKVSSPKAEADDE